MSGDTLTNTDSFPENPSVTFTGEYDNDQLLTGNGFLHWFYINYSQTYTGQFIRNNIHGQGFYFYEKSGERFFYDGPFYANKFEGFGHTFYENGTHYQGLFKQNSRYGPGIFAYEDGSQDVGLWMDTTLIRLSRSVSSANLPKLARTPLGVIKLIKYKHLIRICEESPDLAKAMLKELDCNEAVLEQAQKLYNDEVRNKNSLFFNKPLFDKIFYQEQDCAIDVIDDEYEDVIYEEENLDLPNNQRYTRICDEVTKIQIILSKINEIKRSIEYQIKFCKNCCLPNTGEMEGDNFEEIAFENVQKTNFDSFMDINDDLIFKSYLNYCNDGAENIKAADETAAPKICVCGDGIGDVRFLEDQFVKIEKKKQYFTNVRNYLKSRLYDEFDFYKSTKKVLKKVTVDELLPLNNSAIYTSMIRHTFLNRKTEKNVEFDVCQIIGGVKKIYKPGAYETSCVEFLESCSTGDELKALQSFSSSNINPDICDNKGNTAIIYASAKDRVNIINLLVNFGVNLDSVNDEGVSALNICVLRYLALVHFVSNWEEAFLPETRIEREEEAEVNKWCPKKSFLSLASNSFTESYKDDESTEEPPQKSEKLEKPNEYIFSLNFIPMLKPEKAKGPSRKKSEIVTEPQVRNTEKLNVIFSTIKHLISMGCKADFCEVPFPTLIMAVFSENPLLVKEILLSHADPNITTLEGDLTPLHIVASIKPCPENILICKELVKYGNAALKTSTKHWPEQKMFVMGKETNYHVEDLGKNALHILSLRQDFHRDTCEYFESLTQIFMKIVDVKELYLGHNVLSLAVLSGSLQVIKTIIESRKINPHAVLDYNMGNIMTLFILKKYKDIYPFEICKTVWDFLIGWNVNPLNKIGEFENSIEFMEKEHETVKEVIKSKKSKKDQKKSDKKSKASSKKTKINCEEMLQLYLRELARATIVKYIQFKIVAALYDFAEEDCLENEIIIYEVNQFLTTKETLKILQLIFNSGRIEQKRFSKEICLKVMDFVDVYQKKEKKKSVKATGSTKKTKAKLKASKKDRSKKGSHKNEAKVTEEIVIPPSNQELLDNTDFTLKRKFKNELLPPGLDDINKYKVCYNCLMSREKELYLCPKCELVYYCSDDCNKKGNKLDTLHKCKNLFYKNSKREHEEKLKEGMASLEFSKFSQLIQQANESCNRILGEKIRNEEMEETRRIMEMEANDTYGLLSLKKKNDKMTTSHKTHRGTHRMAKHMDVVRILHSASKGSIIAQKEEKQRTKNSEEESAIYFDQITLASSLSGSKTPSAASCSSSRRSSGIGTQTKDNQSKKIKRSLPIFEEGKSQTSKRHSCIPETCKMPKCVEKFLKSQDLDKDKLKTNKNVIPHSVEKSELPIGIIRQAESFLRKLRKLPDKYQYFIERLAKYFPELDMSFLFLPYACYNGGQLYYRFTDDGQTYSMI